MLPSRAHLVQPVPVVLELGTLEPGNVFGEAGVSHRCPSRFASVVATEQTEVFVMSRWDFVRKIPRETAAALVEWSYKDDDDAVHKEFHPTARWEEFKQDLTGSASGAVRRSR